ncbi:MAG: UDP-N-acetylmuramyl-tripeptide synthetase [Patescibacteria group bacterium]|nr:UDP-N-acetylmuramyl-tripeptide synthetase [Patescibacteria group bacterium]
MLQKIKNVYHLFVAVLANIWYLFPSRKLIVIGVTGTDGKTTTVSLIYHILKESGCNVSMISSVGALINGKAYDIGFHVTTPSSFALQKFLKKALKNKKGKKNYLVLEVTSHALDQHRIFGINFDVGIITNVTHEHLDYHKTYRNYVLTKASLFKTAKVAVINRDDESYKIILNLRSQISNTRWITYGLTKGSDVNPYEFPFKSNLIGEFNKYNILAAIAACKTIGINYLKIKKGIETFKAPIGREEIVYNDSFSVMVDFAHTPNSLFKVLPEASKLAKSRLIHVFGAAGKRDFSKRAKMGEASSKYADIIILTAEDPRGEAVDKITSEIKEGIKDGFISTDHRSYIPKRNDKRIVFEIPDRSEAIDFAVSIAEKGDMVITTGKSHEKSMNYGNVNRI